MHFTAAIEASDELCSDLGQDAHDYLQYLLNGDELGRRRRLSEDGSFVLNFTQARIEWNKIQRIWEKTQEQLSIQQEEEQQDDVDTKDEGCDDDNFYFSIGIGFGVGMLMCLFLGVIMYIIKKTVGKNNNISNERIETEIRIK